MNRTAVIIVNHNNPELTDNLCSNIKTHTNTDFDLYVVETGSKLNCMSRFASLWVKDGIRMTRGFNWGIKYAIWKEQMDNSYVYDTFWLLVNDSHLFNTDTLSPLAEFIRKTPDCGQISPYIDNSPSTFLRKQTYSGERKSSFVEIVCPMFSRKAIEIPGLLDERFFYGWGLDFDIPYILHKNDLKTYISDTVGVYHTPGTTVSTNNDAEIKTVPEQFDISRRNMLDGLVTKYGYGWAKIFYDAIPQDVSKDAYYDWVVNIAQNAKHADLGIF